MKKLLKLGSLFCVITGIIAHFALADKVSDCLQLNDQRACCFSGLDPMLSSDTNTVERAALFDKLLRHGCDLGNLHCCGGLAGRLGLEGDLKGAIQLAMETCAKGQVFSCETAGYYLEKTGDQKKAREMYSKTCRGDVATYRGCKELGRLSNDLEHRNQLGADCTANQKWACVALGYAELGAGLRDLAKGTFSKICQEGPNYSIPCLEVLRLSPPSSTVGSPRKISGPGPLKSKVLLLRMNIDDLSKRQSEIDRIFTPPNAWVEGTNGWGNAPVEAPGGKYSVIYKPRPDQDGDSAAYELYFKRSGENKQVRLTDQIENSSVQISPDSKYIVVSCRKIVDVDAWTVYNFEAAGLFSPCVKKWNRNGKSFIVEDRPLAKDSNFSTEALFWKVELN